MTRPRAWTADVVAQLHAEIGECPLWLPDVERVLSVDIPRGRVFLTDPVSGNSTSYQHNRPVGSVARRASGGFVLCSAGGFYALQDFSSSATCLATVTQDISFRMNDGKADPWGGIVAGCAALDGVDSRAALYRLAPDHSVTPILFRTPQSNGLDWSPDRACFYYIDTSSTGLDVFDVRSASTIINRRRLVTESAKGLLFDGLSVDIESFIWVAVWGGSEVRRYSPSGRFVGRVELPVSCVSSCAFGGRDLRTLYITTARDANKPPEVLAGALFACDVGVCGQPSGIFQG